MAASHPHPTGAAAWNPALRHNSSASASAAVAAPPESDDDDFFARYPGATPKKTQQSDDLPEASDEDFEPSESPVRKQSISVRRDVDVEHSDATDEELGRLPESSVDVQGQAERHLDDEVASSDQESTEAPNLELGDCGILGQEVEERSTVNGIQEDEEELEAIEDDAMNYEHQGEPTAMEAAIEPSAAAPLMMDEEPLPTTEDMSRDSTMIMDDTQELDGSPAPRQPPSKATVSLPHLDRSFTNNFSDSPVTTSRPKGQSIPEDWPAVGDDKTFGELLDSENTHEVKSTLEEAAAQESAQIAAPDDEDDLLPEDEGEVEDLDAAWGAAIIEDDELLEETPTDFDPSLVFGDDDDGFLIDEPASTPQQQLSATQMSQYHSNVQQQQQQQQLRSSQPVRSPPVSAGHGRSAGTPSTGLFDIYNSPGAVQPPQQQSRPLAQPTQSFVDKAKGGYQSPYDLPMDVVKPRRRPMQAQQNQMQRGQQTPGQTPIPPPRSSSMSSAGPPTAGLQNGPPVMSQRPPSSGLASTSTAQPAPTTGTPRSSSGFFEDLPMVAKPRQRPSGVVTPSPSLPNMANMANLPTPSRSSMGPPSRQNTSNYAPNPAPQQTQPQEQFQQQQQTAMYAGLRKPEQMPLIPSQPFSQPMAPQVTQPPVQNTRYSPQQQQQLGSSSLPAPPPVSTSRYSPAPAPGHTQPKQRNPSVPFAPRTSSPLATATVNNTDKPLPQSPPRGSNGITAGRSPERSGPSRYAPTTGTEHPGGMGARTPGQYATPPAQFAPPPMQRPRTQSPDTTMKGPRTAAMGLGMTTIRPSSTAASSIPQHIQQPQPPPVSQASRPALPHRRQFSRELTFAAPTDSRAQDPLQRWRGCPVFTWSPTGAIISTFPKQIPFYAAGQGIPSVKCTPGPITIQDASNVMPLDDRDTKFPGPLTAKRKASKKDVVSWMNGKIEGLQRELEGAQLNFTISVEDKRRVEEKVVLWRVVKLFLEHDGVLEGVPAIEAEMRSILLPNLAQMAQVAELQSPVSAGGALGEVADKQVLFQIRQALLEGQRERAVWLAEEKKLWGHAMMIASTMGPATWKQIVSSFVRSNVKSVGSDARSTAALYQVFAGNAEECVDELVPPSARAGFQMVSRGEGRVGGDPLEGLTQWRETLALIVGNRTAGDGSSLVALGRLLAGYGRCEAGHTCFLFARQFAKHAGADDAEADFVLLGANNPAAKTGELLGTDLDSILLTEIYEYAASLAPTTGAAAASSAYLPHLQSYKLLHAQQLAAHGLKTKAQQYCDSITSAYTSTTRPSPYYHPAFTAAVADLSAQLSQIPGDKASFFARPAMKTVSSGAASWFSKFVAGDEDAASNASSEAAGPFGGLSGEDTGSSGADLYTPMMSGGGMPVSGIQQQMPNPQPFAPSSAPGRYTPGGQRYAPTSTYSSLGVPAAEPQRPGSARYAPAPSSLGVPLRPEAMRRGSDQSSPYALSSRRGSAQDTSSVGSYEPRPMLADHGSDVAYSPAVLSPMVQPVQEQGGSDLDAPLDSLQNTAGEDEGVDAENEGGYLPPTSGYEPPSYSTYQPYTDEPSSPPSDDPPPKKKTFGDDSDDDAEELARRAAALKKSAADREADAAFRAAAEADAARDKQQGQKKGWFGGWLGKKDPNLSSPGPIKAKLGEENSFYYDTNLGKWVNKKAGPEAAAAAASATPPPPRGPANRVTSAPSMGPPSGPPSRASSGPPRPPTSGSMAAPGSGPPSRTGTPMSDGGMNGDGYIASAIPPSMAPPVQRPSSSLSTASSIDDLLAGPRKTGTVKGKKKGGRYVDVMAK